MDHEEFVMFSTQHILAIFFILLFVVLLYFYRKRIPVHVRYERLFAISLVTLDLLYYIWVFTSGRWDIRDSLPLELCSISLLAAVFLLWTGNRHCYDFVFYAGIGGALQAILTPVLDMPFPHFRFFHFFMTHAGIIGTALYFTWIKGYRPTFKGLLKTMLMLNILLPVIFTINVLIDANYMFLRMKPAGGSLLDFLGPYPWYILSLELAAFFLFCLLWLSFRNREKPK